MNVFGHVDLGAMRADEGLMRAELATGGAVLKGRECKCIFHNDGNASAGIYFRDGAWHYKCHGCQFGGDVFDVRAAIKNTTAAEEIRALSPDRPPKAGALTPGKAPGTPVTKHFATLDEVKRQFPKIEATYQYTNPDTKNVDLAVIRWLDGSGKKKFCQCRPVGGGWIMKGLDRKNPIYNRQRLIGAELVIVVEGEKCVHALHDAGFVATTAPGGALNGGKADWSPLAGKSVVLWPDNDEPDDNHPNGKGVSHMREVQRLLEQLTPVPRLSWLDPAITGVGAKGDAADLLAKYDSPDDKRVVIQTMLDEAEPLGASRELRDRFEETIAGKRRAISFGKFQSLSYLSRALVPGTVTCLCGDPGSAKSFWLLQLAIEWHRAGVKTCIYELEDDRSYHMQRAIAQIDGQSDLTDSEWIENNPMEARGAIDRHAEFFDSFGRCLWEAPEEQVTLEMLKEWVRARAEAGYEIIAIDPITAADAEDKPWIADLDFIMSIKTTARRYGCRILLVTHPKKGGKAPSFGLDSLAGGAAYQRFSHTVLWLVRHDPPKDVRVQAFHSADGFTQINQGMRIIKARNGRRAGMEIGFNFDVKTLRFSEAGIVVGTSDAPSPMQEAEAYAAKHNI